MSGHENRFLDIISWHNSTGAIVSEETGEASHYMPETGFKIASSILLIQQPTSEVGLLSMQILDQCCCVFGIGDLTLERLTQ